MATRLTTILVAVIVGATFIAGLIVGAQRDDASGPVDLIIVNGKVYPGAGAELQEAVAVRGNQILRVGSNRDVKRLRRAQTVVLDAHGATVLPGLNDAQVQLMSGALTLEHLDLSPATTIDDIETELRHYAEDKPELPWLVGRNGDADLLAAANAPARKILDEAVLDRPVLVTSEDGTLAWANSRRSSWPASLVRRVIGAAGIVIRDRRTGEPTGVLKDGAVDLVIRAVPATHACSEACGASCGHRRSAQAGHHQHAVRQRDRRRTAAARRNPRKTATLERSRLGVYCRRADDYRSRRATS